MKKTTKSMILALTALSSIALSACGISAKEDFVIDYTYDSPNGESTTSEITAQDILDRYLNQEGTTAAEAYYNAMYEVALRKVFEDENGKFHDYLSEVQADANQDVAEAKDSANEADTSWEDYLINTLNIKGDNLSVEEREHQYYLQCETAAMKEKVSDEFYETFKQWDPSKDTASQEEIDEFNMVYGENGYINTKVPYHVRDILIKVDADASDYTRGEISATNAQDIYDLLSELVKSNTTTNTYGDIARRMSDDTASAATLGEHLMDLDTSFINEFKLGVYTYDSLINETVVDNETNKARIERFSMPQNVEEELSSVGVTYIPYEAAVLLNQYKNTQSVIDPTTGQELSVNEGNADYYPRNIIFNKYFNSHNVSFITNMKVDSSDPTNDYTYTDTGATVKTDIDADGNYKLNTEPYFAEGTSEANHFREIPGLEYPVLCDEKGNPILVSRSETSNAGIHFVVIEKSALETTLDSTPLNAYYAPLTPITQNGVDPSTGDKYYNPDFPTDDSGNQITTYVNNSLTLSVEGYNERVSTLKDKYESYTSTKKDFQLFQWVTEGNFKAANQAIQDKIDQYIEYSMLNVDSTNEQSLIDSWNDYNNTIIEQENARQMGLIPETCAIHFGDPNYYGEGKLCYYTTSANPSTGTNE